MKKRGKRGTVLKFAKVKKEGLSPKFSEMQKGECMKEILIGSFSGIFSGIGMGGGTILIFLLTIFAGLEQHVAQATNLIYFVPTAISAIIVNYREKNIDIKLAKSISFYGVIGAVLGAIISINLEVDKLRKFYGIFLLTIAIHEIYTLIKEYKLNKNRNTKSSN